MATINNSTANTLVSGTSGADSIYNSASTVTIASGEGNDSIYNAWSDSVTIDAGEGNDSIYNNHGDYVSIDAGAGNDSIYNQGDYITIDAGAGNDSIYNSASIVTINAGAGNDSIYNNWGSYSTLNAGAGDDLISLGSKSYYNVIEYASGDGNDSIIGSNSDDTIRITDGSITSHYYDGDDYVIKVGSAETITFKRIGMTPIVVKDSDSLRAINYDISNFKERTVVGGTANADKIFNSDGYNSTINAGAGNDSIYNSGSNNSINAGADNDYIYNNMNFNATINTGAGDDSIYNYYGDDSTINAGAGDDSICNYYVEYSTIHAGSGNDLIFGDSYSKYNEIEYASGDGNDTIIGFKSNDTLRITDGSSYSTTKSGDDIIVRVGSGSMLLKNVSTANIEGGTYLTSNSTINNTLSGVKVVGTSGADSIYNSASTVTIDAGAGNDSICNNDGHYSTINAGAGNDSIYNFYGYYSGIIAGEGDDSIYNERGNYITINAGTGNDLISLDAYSYYNVIEYASGDGNDTIIGFNENDTIRIIDGSITSHYYDGDDYVVKVGSSETLTFKRIGMMTPIVIKDSGSLRALNYDLSNFKEKTVVGGSANADRIFNSRGNYVTINAGAGNDTVYTYWGRYSTINAGVGNDLISLDAYSYYNVIEYASGDGNDTIIGFNYDDTLRLTDSSSYSTTKSGSDLIVNVGSGSMRLKNVSTANIEGGTYLISNNTSNMLVSGTSGRDSIKNTGANVTIQANAGNDTITGSSYGEVFLFSSADGNNLITNFGTNDSLRMTAGSSITYKKSGADMIVTLKGASYTGVETLKGAGSYKFKLNGNILSVSSAIVNTLNGVKVSGTSSADSIQNSGSKVTIESGGGNDTITGSSYGEVFLFSSADGNNLITNFGTNDSLKMTAGKTITYKKSGSDMIVTLKGASYTGVETLKGAGAYNFKLNGNVLSVSSAIVNTLNGVKVSGTSSADSIVSTGSKVTIQGNAGNDTITGSSYGEVFLFSSADGNNLITNFGKNDSLKMTAGKTITYKKSGSDMIVTLKGASYTGVETLKGAGAYNFKLNGNVLSVSSAIVNTLNGVKVSGTSSADSIRNSGSKVTIESGGGNDTITGSSYGEMFLFSSADGNNLITNFGVNDTLKMTAGKSISYKKSGTDMIVTLKGASYTSVETLKGAGYFKFIQSGNILSAVNTINNSRANTLIGGTSSADSIKNSGANVTIQSGAGNDTIDNIGTNILYRFSSADGNNVITNFSRNDTLEVTSGTLQTVKPAGANAVVSLRGTNSSGAVTLVGVADFNFNQSGNFLTVAPEVNEIINGDDGVKIGGTNYADWIFNSGEHVTIQPNAGNDTVIGSDNYGDVFVFSASDGANVITNFGLDDTIKVGSGSIETVRIVGNDAIVSIGNCTIKLLDAGNYNFKRNASTLIVDPINYINNSRSDTLISGTSGRDSITNTGSNVTLEGKGGNDTLTGSDLYGEVFLFSSDGGNDLITNFGRNDTLKIAKGSIENRYALGSDYVVDVKDANYAGSIVLGGAANYKFVQNGSYLCVDPVNTIINRTNNKKVVGTESQDFITNSGSGVSIQAGKGNDTIEGSDYGEVFLFSSADGNNVIMNFGSNDTLKMTSGKTITYSTVGSDVIVTLKGASYTGTVKLLDAATLGSFKVNGTSLVSNSINVINKSSDRIKIVGTDGLDSIVSSGQYVTIQSNGGNDTITGSDLYGDLFLFSSAHGNNLITNFGKNDSLKMTAGSSITYKKSGADMIVTLKGTNYTGIETLKGAGAYSFVKSSNVLTVKDVNEIVNNLDNVKVDGTSGADHIFNGGENVTIASGGGADTIEGSSFGEWFLFSNADGNNVITNFGVNDTLKVTSGSLATVRTVGNDAIVSLNGANVSGSVTLSGAGEYEFVKSGNVLTVKNEVEPIENSRDGVKFSGTGGNDYMINGGSNVTIEGKAGDDTIQGANEGTELFLFGATDGNDVIHGFGANDSLKISGSIKDYYASGSDYVVVVEMKLSSTYTGSVTLKDVGAINIDGSMIRASRFNSSAQLSAEEYWFEQNDQALDELNSIRSIENNQIALEFDPIDRFKANEFELTHSARSRLKK